jgi:hypothetical protein
MPTTSMEMIIIFSLSVQGETERKGAAQKASSKSLKPCPHGPWLRLFGPLVDSNKSTITTVATPRLHILRGSGTNEKSLCSFKHRDAQRNLEFRPIARRMSHASIICDPYIPLHWAFVFSFATILRTLAFSSSVVRILIPTVLSISIPIRYILLVRTTHNYQKSIR